MIEELKGFKLYGMAEALPELLSKPAGQTRLERGLKQLIHGEQVERKAHSLQYQLKAARFPHPRDLSGFNFDEWWSHFTRLTHCKKIKSVSERSIAFFNVHV